MNFLILLILAIYRAAPYVRDAATKHVRMLVVLAAGSVAGYVGWTLGVVGSAPELNSYEPFPWVLFSLGCLAIGSAWIAWLLASRQRYVSL